MTENSGEEVREFLGQHQPGRQEPVWEGKDNDGKQVRLGVYLYRLEFGKVSKTRKFVVIR